MCDLHDSVLEWGRIAIASHSCGGRARVVCRAGAAVRGRRPDSSFWHRMRFLDQD